MPGKRDAAILGFFVRIKRIHGPLVLRIAFGIHRRISHLAGEGHNRRDKPLGHQRNFKVKESCKFDQRRQLKVARPLSWKYDFAAASIWRPASAVKGIWLCGQS